ncbi:unnamed protein product [Sphagnum jensenii]|uniref:Maturase K n=1 Tax=Sphagnum jensenii TaxID=128206 RepID=A0ABP1C2Q7_9BRYO
MHKMKSARPKSSLLFAEERELGLGFRQLLKSFSLAFIDQLIERFEYFPWQIPFLFREALRGRFFSSTGRQQHFNQPSLHH